MPPTESPSPEPARTPADPAATPHAGDRAGSPTHAAFPSTLWSRIGVAEATAEVQAAQESLFATYWPPVYGYVRRRLQVDHQQACDITQDFFLHALEVRLLEKARKSRGRFRSFLKSCLENYLVDTHRRSQAKKRGGHVRRFALDADERPGVLEVLRDPSATPDEVLDEVWRRQLVESALQRVERELCAEGHDVCWKVFADYFLADEDLDYGKVAARYGIRNHDVSNHLRRAKLRYRARLEAMVMETVRDAEQLREELGWLFGSRPEAPQPEERQA